MMSYGAILSNQSGENTEVSRSHSSQALGNASDTVKGRTLRREICYQDTLHVL